MSDKGPLWKDSLLPEEVLTVEEDAQAISTLPMFEKIAAQLRVMIINSLALYRRVSAIVDNAISSYQEEIMAPAIKDLDERLTALENTLGTPVDRIRKEVLRGDYRIPDDYQTNLLGLGDEAAVRASLEQYFRVRGRLIAVSKNIGKPADHRRINGLAAQVAMDILSADKAEGDYRATVAPVIPTPEPTAPATGTTEEAGRGLLAGLRGGS